MNGWTLMFNYWIDNKHENHVVVHAEVPGQRFPAMACSICKILSNNFPSFRLETKCTVCTSNVGMMEVEEIVASLCGSCFFDYAAFRESNPDLLPIDFLRNKINAL
jgi:hypothetical protein